MIEKVAGNLDCRVSLCVLYINEMFFLIHVLESYLNKEDNEDTEEHKINSITVIESFFVQNRSKGNEDNCLLLHNTANYFTNLR